MSDAAFPHGPCECRGGGCRCEAVAGPAAFEVTRGGKRMKVCTCCDLSTDKDRKLLVTNEGELPLFESYDDFGALCIAMELRSKTTAN